jgi:hypothetical protein
MPMDWFTVDQTMRINVAKFPNGFFTRHERGPYFERLPSARTIAFIIHELAHHYGGHLEASYHEALERFGGKLVEMALLDPAVFKEVK